MPPLNMHGALTMPTMNNKRGAEMTEDDIDRWCASLPSHVKMGPGHVVFDDGNYHMVEWCIERATDAIRNNLNGIPDDYDEWTLNELAESLTYLRLLASWLD